MRKIAMKKRLLACVLLASGLFTGAILLLKGSLQGTADFTDDARERLVALNEIEKLTEQDGISPAKEQIDSFRRMEEERSGAERTENASGSQGYLLILVWVSGLLGIWFLAAYTYLSILRPFGRLEKYAGEIARGNLDISLDYDRANPFGAFTWAFDHMRREIIKARACEREAIANNKTVIATLSHDIKTPVASIRAYAEGLEANMDSGIERRQRYLSVIMKKCDQVTKLTNDLLLHSLTDLDKLQIQCQPVEIRPFLRKTLEELSGEKEDLVLQGEIASGRLWADEKRLAQILENIVGNARKYAAGEKICFWTKRTDCGYEIHVRDGGKGIAPEDLPFVFDKFYRGKNTGGQPGAGLGLYIVKYVMTQMKGEVRLENKAKGLEAVLVFPLSESL